MGVIMAETAGTNSKRLLILDDEDEIRSTLAQYFGSLGYAVDTAANVPEALEKLPQDYDVVLSDVMMPKVSGIDFFQQVRTESSRRWFS